MGFPGCDEQPLTPRSEGQSSLYDPANEPASARRVPGPTCEKGKAALRAWPEVITPIGWIDHCDRAG